MLEMWNDRYANPEYAYGTEPNVFFKSRLPLLKLGSRILFPAEGEGRNAVYALEKGFSAVAFDTSVEGRKKALQLAASKGLELQYELGNFMEMEISRESFDAVVLIYAHFPPAIRSEFHARFAKQVKPGGHIIMEGFSTGHLEYRNRNPHVGGPGKIEMLYNKEMIQTDFPGFDPIYLEDEEVELSEGLYHRGTGKVLRYVGLKAGQ
jgi:hypothetical protein